MNTKVIEYLKKQGYSVSQSYYQYIDLWTDIWKGKQEWIQVTDEKGHKFPMYSLGIGKRSCEDFASMLTNEPYEIKASKDDNLLQELLEKAKVLDKLPNSIETMAYSGTVGTVVRVKNAILKGNRLVRGENTKIQTIDLKASQIIPLRIDDGKFVDMAFVSETQVKVNGKTIKCIYLETHILEEKGYQVTNKYFTKDQFKEITVDGIIPTYNTLSQVPLFSINKINKMNTIDDNNGLGQSLYANAIDQLKILDLTYNNFGMDFKLGQKVMVINKNLTKVDYVDVKQPDGTFKQVPKVTYPTDVQKQLFREIGNDLMDDKGASPYIYEYNPDLRVGDNRTGVQAGLDDYAFKVGYGTHFYNFTFNGGVTATEWVGQRQDLIANGNKNRKAVKEYLIGICKALLLADKMLGTSVDENQDIIIPDADNFLEDDAKIKENLRNEFNMGLMSKLTYLMKTRKLTEEEARKELQLIEEENKITNIDLGE